jgi:cytochrome c oxidase subunit 2
MLQIFVFGFQDSATPIMEGIVDLHNHIFFFAILILFFVIKIFFDIVYTSGFYMYNNKKEYINEYNFFKNYNINKVGISVNHNSILEIIWTILPILILIFIAIPSFVLLYSMDEIISPILTLKAIGHQWYWSYEYSNIIFYSLINIEFDSYMVSTNDLKLGEFRLLTVDNEVVLPINLNLRIITTSIDVLHSWSVNSLGVKMDAVPGRLSQIIIFIKRSGIFYGQCSELCGVNHGFMPIVIKAIRYDDYIKYIWDSEFSTLI